MLLTRIGMFFITICSKILTYLAGLGFIEDLWDGLTSVVQKVITFFGTLFTSMVSLFWTTGENGGLTMIGWLTLLTLAVGLFWLAFRFIRGLISGMGRRR